MKRALALMMLASLLSGCGDPEYSEQMKAVAHHGPEFRPVDAGFTNSSSVTPRDKEVGR